MTNVRHIEVAAGEDRTVTLYARNADNDAVSLAGKTVLVTIGRDPQYPDSPEAIVTLDGTLSDAAAGEFTITVPASVTRYAGGDYEYVARSYNGSGSVVSTVCRGRFRVVPTLV